MDWLKRRGIKFLNLRMIRGLEINDVASMLMISHLAIVAFECGVIMQRLRDEESQLASLMLKWEAETYDTRFKSKQIAGGNL